MKEFVNVLRDIFAKKEPENIKIGGKENVIGNVSVTVHGTWQKHGHSFKIGIVFAISVWTGEVLDWIAKSVACHTCMKHV